MNDRPTRDALIVSGADLPERRARAFRRCLPRPLNTDDAADVGQFGLIRAADRWRVERGIPFRSYAIDCIDNAIRSLIRYEQRMGRSREREVAFDPAWHVTHDPPRRDLIPLLTPSLSRDEQLIVRLHYEDGMTLWDVARCVGVVRSRITEIHQKMLSRLRDDPRVIEAAEV